MLWAFFEKQTLPDNFKMGLTWESYSYQFDSNAFSSSFLSSYIAKIGLYCIYVALFRTGFTKQRKYWAIVHEIQEIAFTDAALLVSLQSPGKWKNGKFVVNHKLFGFTVSVEYNLYFGHILITNNNYTLLKR